ncbi:hypothetical protein C8Q73DRAFT_12198 [Cubamyces lactineus]|nr:hypothetical protein C8Q73DRAFT_12198 [Cubamyces lactineus]
MRIRRAIGTSDSTYQLPDRADSPQYGRSPPASAGNTYVAQGPPKSLPDVPLNPDHRYCTPPPMDPRFIDQPREKDDFPQYNGRRTLPGGFEEVTVNHYPTAPDGSKNNPYVVEDDENARRHREARRQSVHSSKSESSSSRRSSKSPSRHSSRATPVPTRKAPAPPSHTPPASSSSSSSSRTTRSSSSKGSATPPGLTPTGRARYQKTAADGFTPKAPSPLKQVAYAASPRMNTPVSNAWYVPPKKHSTGSVVVAESESSSDSEYSDY